MGIKTGDPVVLVNAAGLENYFLANGDKGWANAITTVPGDGDYVFFMPTTSKQVFVIDVERVEYDKSREGQELNQDTIHKE